MPNVRRRLLLLAGLLAAPSLPVIAPPAAAEDTVKIGVIEPLSGGAASAGQAIKAALELGTEIVNTPYPDMQGLPLAAGTGFPGLGGRKLELDYADNQGSPAVGQNQALRLITQDHVVALFGAYQSGITLTTSAVAERYGIPFLAPESVATNLTERGFKWFFRTTPIGPDIARAYIGFVLDQRKQGRKIDSVAIVNDTTEYGTSIAEVIKKQADAEGVKVTQNVTYNVNATDVSSQVLQLKQASPDLVIFISYTSDAILYARTMKNLDYRPPIVIGDDSGFSDPSFIESVGDLVQGAINRSAFAPGRPGTLSYKMNALYHQRFGRDLDETSARSLQGFFVLVDAINRAGSTDPGKIQAALRATDMKPAQLFTGYNGVKFDDKGQNTESAMLLTQLQGKDYVAVWPQAEATGSLQLPYAGWK
ncbi:MAG: ABC transporter substrate-binding protein [Acidisphaera sp.]|nr:ABC transporter substrate-binding protein [Acidisphaera sp.]